MVSVVEAGRAEWYLLLSRPQLATSLISLVQISFGTAALLLHACMSKQRYGTLSSWRAVLSQVMGRLT